MTTGSFDNISEEPKLKKNVVITLYGEERYFRCECGCNVFHELQLKPLKYGCNSCKATYSGEK